MKTKQITRLGLFLAISLVLAYLESLLPVIVAVPGVKLGLANILTILVLYQTDWKKAFFLMILRVVMAGFLFSGVAGIIYSFAGGVCCIFIMSILKRFSFFSVAGVSMAGAVFHNLGQIVVAVFVMENAHLLYYFPVLCLSGALTGLLTGYVSALLIQYMNKVFPKED